MVSSESISPAGASSLILTMTSSARPLSAAAPPALPACCPCFSYRDYAMFVIIVDARRVMSNHDEPGSRCDAARIPLRPFVRICPCPSAATALTKRFPSDPMTGPLFPLMCFIMCFRFVQRSLTTCPHPTNDLVDDRQTTTPVRSARITSHFSHITASSPPSRYRPSTTRSAMSQILTAVAFLAATLAFGSNARSPGSWEQISHRLGTGWENLVQRVLPENDGWSANERERIREKSKQIREEEEARHIMGKNSNNTESPSRPRSDTTPEAVFVQQLQDTIKQAISRPAPHLASSDPSAWENILRGRFPYRSDSRSTSVGGSTLVGGGSRSGSSYPADGGDSTYGSMPPSPGLQQSSSRGGAWGEDFLQSKTKNRSGESRRPIPAEKIYSEHETSSRDIDRDASQVGGAREPENASYLSGKYHDDANRRVDRPDMGKAVRDQLDPRNRDGRSDGKSSTRERGADPRDYRNDRNYDDYIREDRQRGDRSRGGRGRGIDDDEDRYGDSRYRETGRERDRGRSRRGGYDERYDDDVRYQGRSGGRSRRDYEGDDDYRETGRYRDEKSRRRSREKYNRRRPLDDRPYDDEGNPIHPEHGRRGLNGEILGAAATGVATGVPGLPVIVNNVIGGMSGLTAAQPTSEPVSRDIPKVEEPRTPEPQETKSTEQAEVAPDSPDPNIKRQQERRARYANAGNKFSGRGKRNERREGSGDPTPEGKSVPASVTNDGTEGQQAVNSDATPQAPPIGRNLAQERPVDEGRRGRTLPSDASGSAQNTAQTERPRSSSGRWEQARSSDDTLAEVNPETPGIQSLKVRGRHDSGISVTSPIDSINQGKGAEVTADGPTGSPVSPTSPPASASSTRLGPRHQATVTENRHRSVQGMEAELAYATDAEAESTPVRPYVSVSAESPPNLNTPEARPKRKRRLGAERGEKEIRDISRNVIQGQSSVLKRHGVTGPKSFGRLIKLAFKSSPKMAFLSAVAAGIYAIGVVYLGNRVAKMEQTTALASQPIRRQSLDTATSTSVPADLISTSTSTSTFDSFERDTQVLIILCMWHAVWDLILLLLTHHIWNGIPDPNGERSYGNWLDRFGLLSVLRVLGITAPMAVYLLLGARQLTSCAYLLNDLNALVWSIGPDVGLSWDYLAQSLSSAPDAASGDAMMPDMPDMPDTEGLQLLGISAFFWFTGLPVFLYSIKRVLHPGSPSRLKVVKRIKRGHSGMGNV